MRCSNLACGASSLVDFVADHFHHQQQQLICKRVADMMRTSLTLAEIDLRECCHSLLLFICVDFCLERGGIELVLIC